MRARPSACFIDGVNKWVHWMSSLRTLTHYTLLMCAVLLVACDDKEGDNSPDDTSNYAACEADDEVVEFASDNLANKVRTELGLPSGAITCSDMATLKVLDARSLHIDSIEGIEHAVQLETLSLDENEIRELGPLAGLDNLKNLRLPHNRLSDLGPLAEITSLITLELGYNEITDLSPLSSLTSLEGLGLSEQQLTGTNRLEDLSPLKPLVALKNLVLNGNALEDLTDLKELYSLEILNLSNNNISDVSPLGSLRSLTQLRLLNNEIEVIVSLGFLQDLNMLLLVGNHITNDALAEMEPLKQLSYLSVADNKLTSLRGLQFFDALSSLDASKNEIDDIDLVSHISDELELLNLRENRIVGIEQLEFVPTLVDLYLTSNEISDLHAVEDLEFLERLYVEDNLIEDITPIVVNASRFTTKRFEYVMLNENCLDVTPGSQTMDQIGELVGLDAHVQFGEQKNCVP